MKKEIGEGIARMLAEKMGADVHFEDDDDAGEGSPQPIVEAQIETLREVCQTYHAGNTYKVGDLITPRRGYGTKGAGIPHVVIEVFDPPIRVHQVQNSLDSTSNGFGRRMDLRVATMSNGRRSGLVAVCCFHVESFEYEPFVIK